MNALAGRLPVAAIDVGDSAPRNMAFPCVGTGNGNLDLADPIPGDQPVDLAGLGTAEVHCCRHKSVSWSTLAS